MVVIVLLVHALAVGAVMFIQGCGTTTPRQPAAATEPPPAPVMPPKDAVSSPSSMVSPKPVFQPPAPVEPMLSEARTYTIASGDSLSKIAKRHGVSARELAELNGIKDPNKIRIGQKIALPDYASGSVASKPKPSKSAAPSKPKSSAAPAAGGPVYVVQAGDSLSKIASKHGVKVNALREANKLSGDKILVGQKLVIPTGAKPDELAAPVVVEPSAAPEMEPAPAPMAPVAPAVEPPPAPAPAPASPMSAAQDQPLDYTVQDGDTLDSIAKLFIVRREDIMKLNTISDPASVKPGMKLKIPPTSL
ncbi:MAG: hypothetical protein BWK77_08895 [Verrucomicrobia bacterium A1]|nr:MAG: hypothetical protein BWK77_08895 [Verrucomicrobia bacterium A1]